MTLALAETGLVHVEMLVLPRRVVERLADVGRDALDRVVVALLEVERDVDLTGEEGSLLAFLVAVELVGDAVEAGLAAARGGRAGPVVVTDELDRVGRRGAVLERAHRDRLAERGRHRVRLGRPVLDRDGLHVVLGQDDVRTDHAEPAGISILEVDVSREAVGRRGDLVDLLPAEGGDAGLGLVEHGLPRVDHVVQGERLAVRPLQVRQDLDVDGEARRRRRILGHVVRVGDRTVRDPRHPVAVRRHGQQGRHGRRHDLGVGERVREVVVELVRGLPFADDGLAARRARGRLVLEAVEQLVVVDRGRCRCGRRGGRSRRL